MLITYAAIARCRRFAGDAAIILMLPIRLLPPLLSSLLFAALRHAITCGVLLLCCHDAAILYAIAARRVISAAARLPLLPPCLLLDAD